VNKRRGRTQNGRGAPMEMHGHMPASEQADEDSEEPMSTEETSKKEEQAVHEEGEGEGMDEGEGEM